MAEQTTVIEKPAASADTNTGGGFNDPSFLDELQAAIDKDAGKEPSSPAATATSQAEQAAAQKTADDAAAVAAQAKNTKVEAKKAPESGDEIPAALLGEKPKDDKKAEPATDQTEADRLKFIEEQTKGMTPKAADRFKKIELRAHEAEQAAKKIQLERETEKTTLQKQIEELNQKALAKPDDAEINRLKKQVEDLDAIINKAALQEHPKFKAHYDGQILSEIEKVKKLIPAENADELAGLLVLPESKKRNERITEIVEGLDDIQKTKVLSSLDRVDRLASEKADELAKWRENKIHIEADAIRQQQEASKNVQEFQLVAWTKGIEAVSSDDRGLEVFKKLNGDDAWNATVDNRINEVKKILTNPNIPPEKLVEIAARAVAVDDYRRMFLAQRALVSRLREEIEGLKVAEPDAGDGGGSDGAATDTDDFITATIKGTIKDGALRQ
jgi:hypothetical protein